VQPADAVRGTRLGAAHTREDLRRLRGRGQLSHVKVPGRIPIRSKDTKAHLEGHCAPVRLWPGCS
jgi:hypothetical protein